MKFSLPVFVGTSFFVILSGIVSFFEGTLTSRRVTIGFINHAGMWGDLIIMSTVAGLIYPYLNKNVLVISSSCCLSVAVAVTAHVQWAKGMASELATGHMFPAHETRKWYLDMSISGWMHLFLMIFLLAIVFIYVGSPVPMISIIAISALLTAHVFMSTIQPGWYATGKFWTWKNLGLPLFTSALIWSVTFIKTRVL